MAPVVAMVHVHDVDRVGSGRAEAGPYDGGGRRGRHEWSPYTSAPNDNIRVSESTSLETACLP